VPANPFFARRTRSLIYATAFRGIRAADAPSLTNANSTCRDARSETRDERERESPRMFNDELKS